MEKRALGKLNSKETGAATYSTRSVRASRSGSTYQLDICNMRAIRGRKSVLYTTAVFDTAYQLTDETIRYSNSLTGSEVTLADWEITSPHHRKWLLDNLRKYNCQSTPLPRACTASSLRSIMPALRAISDGECAIGLLSQDVEGVIEFEIDFDIIL